MPAPEKPNPSARKPLGADVAQLVELWGNRVFVAEPRLLCFSHRPLASLRHPHWPTILALGDKHLSRKKGQAKAERIAELLAEGSQPAIVAAEKWRIVGELYDSKATEPRLSQLRASVCNNHTMQLLLERLWASLGCDHRRGITFEAYFRLNALLYSVVLGSLDLTPLQKIITKAIQRDWVLDSAGAQELNFGQWCVSMLELIDNWEPTAVVDAYVAYAEELFPSLQGDSRAVRERDTMSWDEKDTFLQRNAALFNDQPLVKAVRNARNCVEYTKIDTM